MTKRNSRGSPLKRLTVLLLVIVLGVTGIGFTFVVAADDTPDPPKASRIFVYNNTGDYYPVVYIVTGGTDMEATGYRVYFKNSSNMTLLYGAGTPDENGNCAILLNNKVANGKNLYVTRLVGEKESTEVAVTVGTKLSPSVQLNLYELPTSPTIAATTDSKGTSVSLTKSLTAGKFYEAEILVTQIQEVDSIQAAIHYDPTLLRPAEIYADNTLKKMTLKSIDASFLAEAAGVAGEKGFTVGDSVSLSCGVYKGIDFDSWNGMYLGKSYEASFIGSGEYTYWNSTTGVFEVSAGIGAPISFYSQAGAQVIRFYFEALETTSLSDLPVRWATEGDCPKEYMDGGSEQSFTYQKCYYDPYNPEGISVTLADMSVIPTNVELTASTRFTEKSPTLVRTALALAKADSLETLDTLADTSPLGKDEVKIYNYTNSSSATLKDSLSDRLVIDASDYIRASKDQVLVYKTNDPMETSGFPDQGKASGEGKVDINLGTNYLDPEGGVLYLSVIHNGVESARKSFRYKEEVQRTVTFQILRDTEQWQWAHDYESSEGVNDYQDHPELLSDLKKGEHIQLRICFNNIYDLLSYGIALNYNTLAVQPADSSFMGMDDPNWGYFDSGDPYGSLAITQDEYEEDFSPFLPGDDVLDISMTDELVYQTFNKLADSNISQAELDATIEALLPDLGLDREAFDAAYAKANEYHYGNDKNPAGLIFNYTEGKTNRYSIFPLVDNGHMTGNSSTGYIQLLSTQLTKRDVIAEGDGLNFLTINFVAVAANRDPEFELSMDSSILGNGLVVTLEGGNTSNVAVSDQWKVYPMEDTPDPPSFSLGFDVRKSGENVDPLSLHLNTDYSLAVGYENLIVDEGDTGITKWTTTFTYDSSRVSLSNFVAGRSGVTIADTAGEGTTHTVTLQYQGSPISAETGTLGTCTLRALSDFSEDDDVFLRWVNYAADVRETSTAETRSYDKAALLAYKRFPAQTARQLAVKMAMIILDPGNPDATEDPDEVSTTMFVYAGDPFVDSFSVRNADGELLTESELRRVDVYYMEGTEKKSIPADRVLPVRNGGYSDTYEIFYEYNGAAASRIVHVIYFRGDVNRDGQIDVFDEQMMANQINGFHNLDTGLEDDLFRRKTANVFVDDSIVNQADRALLHDHIMGITEINQIYRTS